MGIFPNFRNEKKKYLKPPPSCNDSHPQWHHHPTRWAPTTYKWSYKWDITHLNDLINGLTGAVFPRLSWNKKGLRTAKKTCKGQVEAARSRKCPEPTTTTLKSPRSKCLPLKIGEYTLQGTNISHLENHIQNAILGGYVSSQEGINIKNHKVVESPQKFVSCFCCQFV